MSSVYTITSHCLHEIQNQAIILINNIKKDQRLMHPKFQPYLDRFIYGFVSNSLQCFIAERDLKITYHMAIVYAM